MNTRVPVAAIVFIALAFPAPCRAQGAPSAAPVTINSCGPELSNSSNAPSVAGVPLTSTSSGVKIEFVNESSKVADLVNFAVTSNGTQFVIRDVGTFSPGVSITHRFRNGSGQSFVLPSFIAPDVSCEVASVRFADGSFWTKGQAQTQQPAASGSSSAKLTASPARVDIDHTTESDLFLVSSAERVTAFKESDNCGGVAGVFVAATGQSSASYSVKPVAPGSCTAQITDEAGNTLSVPIIVH
ncbi:MAG TPA: hypothetical protein VGZ02_00075 [Candidatus Baltobacteraceae bacterium]|nr:hypothetical protein [Candidatus Baltobacteraceae bacterium]